MCNHEYAFDMASCNFVVLCCKCLYATALTSKNCFVNILLIVMASFACNKVCMVDRSSVTYKPVLPTMVYVSGAYKYTSVLAILWVSIPWM